MKKLLLAAGVAMAVSGVQSSLAADATLRINNGGADIDVPLSNFDYDIANQRLTVTTTATVSLGSGGNDGGNSGGGDDGEPGGGDDGEPGGGDDGEPGGNDGACDVAGVTCGFDIAAWPKEANKTVTIPKGGIIASKFTTHASTNAYAKFLFEARAASPYPGTDFWVSRTPGGPAISDKCSRSGVSMIFSLDWTQGSNSRKCQLAPSTTYYMNMKHTNAKTNASTVYRFIQ